MLELNFLKRGILRSTCINTFRPPSVTRATLCPFTQIFLVASLLFHRSTTSVALPMMARSKSW